MRSRINLYFISFLALGMIAAVIIAAAVFYGVLNGEDKDYGEALFEMIIVVILVFAILCYAGVKFCRRIISPIEKLSDIIRKEDVVYDEIEPEYTELSTLMDTIKMQHKGIIDNADMRQQFTANVTHELKTPLTAITGYSELIENGMASGEDVRRFAGEIRKNSMRLLTLINDIIRLSELDMVEENEEYDDVDLYEVADTCLNMLQFNADKNNVSLKLNGEHSVVRGDKVMIEEVVYNLCDNAIRYNIKEGKVEVSVRENDDSVILSVKDTGIGIPKEHQNRIFERFYRVDKSRSKEKGGTGLGLAIVKHILARHNAEIYIASEEGKGTEMIIIFNKNNGEQYQ